MVLDGVFIFIENILSGIYRDNTMADKLMYILNDNTQNYPFRKLNFRLKRMDTKFYKQTNQNSLNFPKFVKPTNKKTLGTCVISSPLSPLSLWVFIFLDNIQFIPVPNYSRFANLNFQTFHDWHKSMETLKFAGFIGVV